MKQFSLARLLCTLLLLLGGVATAAAQGSETDREPTPPPRAGGNQVGSTPWFGVIGSGDLVVNSASFGLFPGIVTCQGDSVAYAGSSSPGYSAGLTASILPTGLPGFPKIGGMVTLGLRGSSASFEAEEQIGQTLMPGDVLAPVMSRYEIDASYLSVYVDPTLLFRPSTSGLLLLAGPSLSFPISASYDQREVLAEPSSMTFLDGRSERTVGSGDVESPASIVLGLQAGVAWHVPLSGGLALRPSLLATLGLTDNATDVTWKSHALRLGLSLLYSPEKEGSTPLQP